MLTQYTPPLALTVISSISIAVAAVFSLFVFLDILLRKGWRSMMAVMIPVYVINALYIWPITLWTYLNYGRPKKPSKTNGSAQPSCHAGHNSTAQQKDAKHPCHQMESGSSESHGAVEKHHLHHRSERPMFATITVAVCHCGAGCVLGDIVGEWLVYGTGAEINGQMLWTEFLVDFAFALFFGVFFQYFSIAPMSGVWGPQTFIRAAKADFLSLAFFEIGLFGWMAIFQIAIFGYRLDTASVTYWWMMQVGMFFGHWTAMPINWVLIKNRVKEPCA